MVQLTNDLIIMPLLVLSEHSRDVAMGDGFAPPIAANDLDSAPGHAHLLNWMCASIHILPSIPLGTG